MNNRRYQYELCERSEKKITDNILSQKHKGNLHDLAFIYSNIQDNFHPDSYKNIIEDKNNNWKQRLEKRHSFFKIGLIKEMQSSNSSDALLMNIFCHPKVGKWKGVSNMLEVDFSQKIEFGWKNIGFHNEKNYKTEVDMKIGDCLFESKLTESNFTEKDLNIVKRYQDVDTVFDLDFLMTKSGKVKNYQLIRELNNTIIAVKDSKLRHRISFVTWQEISSVCGNDLKSYLQEKYF